MADEETAELFELTRRTDRKIDALRDELKKFREASTFEQLERDWTTGCRRKGLDIGHPFKPFG